MRFCAITIFLRSLTIAWHSPQTLPMQSHKNQIHRLLLIDRVLQSNTFNRPNGATRESIEQSVRELLTSDEAQFLTSLPFEQLWKGKDAFRKDLKFILTHYPGIMQKQGNKLWSYQIRGMSIFPRFGDSLDHQAVQEGILLLEYCKDHPMSEEFNAHHIITILKKWYGMTQTPRTGKNPYPTYKHQFYLEDAETLSSIQAKTLYDCCEANGKHLVNVRYRSSRTQEIRELEFHPWQFIQSEGRWYVAGYISKDILGNYPSHSRSNFPGIVLKLDEIQTVSIIPKPELDSRKQNRSFIESRHTYQSQQAYPSLLMLENRIGIGGWDKRLGTDIQKRQTLIRFQLAENAIPYFKSSPLYSYVRPDPSLTVNGWLGFKILVKPKKKMKRHAGLVVINRETCNQLRAFGPQLIVHEPSEIRSMLKSEAELSSYLYNTPVQL